MSAAPALSAPAFAAARRASWRLNGVLALLLSAAFVGSLTIGYVDIPLGEILRGLAGTSDEVTRSIVRELRLPRSLLAVLVGASLGLSGAVLQGLLRNPLAEPGVIGITSSAGLGAVIAFYFGFASSFALALPLSAMAGAALATVALYLLAMRDASTLTLILAGVAISGLAVALTTLAMNLSTNPWAVNEIIVWLLGSVKDRSMQDVTLILPFVLAGVLCLALTGRTLDALSLGEEAALSLGADLKRARSLAIAGTSLAVGAAVSVTGSIGFVGLVVPHLMRPFTGHMPSRLLLPSALGGALLLLVADLLVRLIDVGPELQLGVVTSLIGAPFFFYLILKTRREMR